MSDAQAPRPAYDPNELRRCIALCFSPNDLRTFAENLGVTNLGTWDHGIQDGAREVVRHFERLGTLEQLVAKLAAAKPLMEWPSPPPNVATAETVVEPPQTVVETNEGPPATPPPFAPLMAAAPIAAPPVKPVTPTESAPAPVLHDPFAPAWPGTAPSSTAPNQNSIEGRKLVPFIAAGLVLVSIVAIGILLAVRGGRATETAETEIVAGRPLRANGPARMAADAMKRSLESLARGCDLELPRGTDVDVWLFSAAYTQCGTRLGIAFPPPGLRVDKPRPLDTTSDLFDAPANAPTAKAPRQTNPGTNVANRPAPAPAPAKPAISDGCVDKCVATKQRCNRACGSEPTSGSEFDRWQGCRTQCLSAASRCQLACQ